MIVISSSLARCEARLALERHRVPTLAVVGASYTAGVGPDNPVMSWAVLLAGRLRWNAVVYGVPGAGYANPGNGGRGPVDRMIAQERLRALRPALVIVQAGLGDRGEPAAREMRRVRATVGLIRSAAPGARIALITIFTGIAERDAVALRRLDRAIVTGARKADPGIIIMSPLAGRWRFPRQSDGLHPTAAGDAWIAGKVGSVLAADGVRAASVAATVPVICDASVGVTTPPATDRDA
jgi:lysophospholipase L1-like esterase